MKKLQKGEKKQLKIKKLKITRMEEVQAPTFANTCGGGSSLDN